MEKNMQKTALEKLIATDKELRDFGFQWPGVAAALRTLCLGRQSCRCKFVQSGGFACLSFSHR